MDGPALASSRPQPQPQPFAQHQAGLAKSVARRQPVEHGQLARLGQTHGRRLDAHAAGRCRAIEKGTGALHVPAVRDQHDVRDAGLFERMRGADVSQLPIIQDGRLVGILDESDLVHVMNTDEITRKERFARPVASAMTRDLDTVQVGETLDALIPLFDRDRVAIILDGEQFVGLITRTDLINHLSLNR